MKIKVKNFRSIKKLEIDLNRNVSTIIGPNESGKSNFLDAIYAINKFIQMEKNDFLKTGNDYASELSIGINWSFESLLFKDAIEKYIQKYSKYGSQEIIKKLNKIRDFKFDFNKKRSWTYLNEIKEMISIKRNEDLIRNYQKVRFFYQDILDIIKNDFKEEFDLTNTYIMEETLSPNSNRYSTFKTTLEYNSENIQDEKRREYFLDTIKLIKHIYNF